ncbi:MAG: rhomboid family intramembrane serine protease [Candidatus Aenigmatarchaeota archaeon]
MSKKFRWYAAKLAIVCIIVYLIELSYPNFMLNNFALVSSRVIMRPWTIITHAFLHSVSDIAHIFYNMFALILFGSVLERFIGSKKFLMVFFISVVTSAFGGIAFYDTMIGASGAIMGILGTLSVLRPKMIVWAFGVPVPLIIACALWALGDIIGFFAADYVAHAAHLFGLLTGVLIGFVISSQNHEKKIIRKNKILDNKEIEEWENKWFNK